MEACLREILVLVQQGLDSRDIEVIEQRCKQALAEAWGCSPEEVGTPDLIERA
jgi:hypothetical protein